MSSERAALKLQFLPERLPAARNYDVVLEDGEGTEGPKLVDEVHCRYVDFLQFDGLPRVSGT